MAGGGCIWDLPVQIVQGIVMFLLVFLGGWVAMSCCCVW